jgi:hypothetical protein
MRANARSSSARSGSGRADLQDIEGVREIAQFMPEL